MPLAQFVSVYLPALEDELRRAVGAAAAAAPHLREYYLMMDYHLGWADEKGKPLPAGLGGKRIRPLLCLLACAASGGEWERALPMAAAIELLHNFSLLHDDIQDNSPLRRGRLTVWRKWGPAQAINAGDAMFTLAHLAPHQLTARGVAPETALAALAEFDRTALALTQGQHMDMKFETRERVKVEEYLTMIEGKTAALIAACAQLGALLAGASAERAGRFRQFGRSLGLAFQVQDDWLGIWGDPAVTGKSAASDLEKRKKSLPVVYGLERSEAFADAYSRPHVPSESISEMAAALEKLGARDYTQNMAQTLTAEAMHHLDAAQPEGAAGEALRELTDQLLNRKQ
jgi:geranylgeranyl diphosphate synthase type I